MQYVMPRAPGTRALPGGGIAQWTARELLAPFGFVGAILLTNYAMASLPNVKLFDLLVFVAGYTMGLRRGTTVAVAAWLVYGQINPWGVAHAQLLLTLMASETLYAAVGALMRRFVKPSSIGLRPGYASLALVAAALLTTGAYDLLTNVFTGYYWALVAGRAEYGRWITIALFNPGALFFMAVHVGSNLMFFPAFGPLLIRGAERGKERFGWTS